MKIKILSLAESEWSELTFGFRNGEKQRFQMRCRCVLFKPEGLSNTQVGVQTEMIAQSVNGWVGRFETGSMKGSMKRGKSISFMVMNPMLLPKATFHTDGSFLEKKYLFLLKESERLKIIWND